MSPRRNRPPPALRTPSVPFIKPHRATAGRRASFVALRNAMSVIGTVSSDSTSTGHRKRNPRAALRNARALPPRASLSARETASEGAGRSQLTESGKHYLTATVHPSTETTAVAIPKFMTKLRFLIWPAASNLAHTWRTPGAPLNSDLAHSCRTPVALLSHSCRTPVALLSHSCRTPCRTPVALLSHPVAHSWLSRCGPPSAGGCLQTNHNTKPPPAGFGGSIRRSHAIKRKKRSELAGCRFVS